jgi:uncharacterized protein
MRIGLVADTHNDHANTLRALARLRTERITHLLHAGDVTSAQTLRLFEGFDVWIARGNMDHDPGLIAVAQELFGPGRFRRAHNLTLHTTPVAVVHDGDAVQARQIIFDRVAEVLVLGHTHSRRDERLDGIRIINPGALGNTRWQRPTFAILDLSTGDLTWVEL